MSSFTPTPLDVFSWPLESDRVVFLSVQQKTPPQTSRRFHALDELITLRPSALVQVQLVKPTRPVWKGVVAAEVLAPAAGEPLSLVKLMRTMLSLWGIQY